MTELLFVQLPGEFIQAPLVDAWQQVSRMRLVVECRNGWCALCQTAAQRLVHYSLEWLLRFPSNLRQSVGQIVFERERCPHRDIMMPLISDVKMHSRDGDVRRPIAYAIHSS